MAPPFVTSQGVMARSKEYELALMERLSSLQRTHPHLFPPDLDIYEQFGISRSFRRGATSTARARGVNDRQVDLINRWRSFENARGKRPTLSMHDHYSDIQILILELTQFSRAL